jgi:hypothetical protein
MPDVRSGAKIRAGRLITAPSIRSPMLYPAELQARVEILAGRRAAVNIP